MPRLSNCLIPYLHNCHTQG